MMAMAIPESLSLVMKTVKTTESSSVRLAAGNTTSEATAQTFSLVLKHGFAINS